jgi:hypothetical protein
MPLTLRLSPTLELQLEAMAVLIKGGGREVTPEDVAWIALADGLERLRELLPELEQSSQTLSQRSDRDPDPLGSASVPT